MPRYLLLGLILVLLMPIPAHAAQYVVQPGDTLAAIARRYGVSQSALAAANGISNANVIVTGHVLTVPAGTSVSTVGEGMYRVQWGDSLSSLALRFGTTVSTLQALNPSLGQYLLTGQWLRLTGSSAPVALTTSATYVVQPGDTLSAIASAHGVTVASLAAVNNLRSWDLVVAGSHLSIPVTSVSVGATTSNAVYDPYGARSLITYWASVYGVPVTMALAVAWQESGFNQSAVSSTGAIGVMQMEPYTAVRVDQMLGRTFDLSVEGDNVQAGVYWLSVLLHYYGGDERMAVAAYYEGTRNVARFGLFTDTVQYVADVMALMGRFGG